MAAVQPNIGAVYNLNTNEYVYLPFRDSPFCSAHIQLIDDRILVVGGDNVGLDPTFTDGMCAACAGQSWAVSKSASRLHSCSWQPWLTVVPCGTPAQAGQSQAASKAISRLCPLGCRPQC